MSGEKSVDVVLEEVLPQPHVLADVPARLEQVAGKVHGTRRYAVRIDEFLGQPERCVKLRWNWWVVVQAISERKRQSRGKDGDPTLQ